MVDVNQKKCTGCGACYNICPVRCIEMKENDEGFLYPVIKGKNCINCNACEKVCPLEKKQVCEMEFYGVVNKADIPQSSSSTGLAYKMAKAVIENGGTVFGAVFNDDCEVVHKSVNSLEAVESLSGSKYIQSNMQKNFNEVKTALEQEKMTLFVGTPCQVAGLLSFLGKKYENLYTVDFICHGVPSPKVWRYYLKNIREKYRLGKIKSINFRDRKYGWANYGLSINGDENEYFALRTDDLYETAFSRNITLRKSCYLCDFKDKNRYSDIMLGDFWGGVEHSRVFNSNGTSIVSVNTKQGKKLFEMVFDEIDYEKVNVAEYFKYHNRAMVTSVKHTNIRSKFFDEFAENPDKVEMLLGKYIKKTNLPLKIAQIRGKLARGKRKILKMFKCVKG